MLCTFTFIQKCKEIIHVHQNCGKHHILANSEMAPYFFIFANGNKTEPREDTKQVVWIILRKRIFHGTIRHIRSGFPSYARTLCALTLLAYALKFIIVLSLKIHYVNISALLIIADHEFRGFLFLIFGNSPLGYLTSARLLSSSIFTTCDFMKNY